MDISLTVNEYKHLQAYSFIQTWTVGIAQAKIVSYIEINMSHFNLSYFSFRLPFLESRKKSISGVGIRVPNFHLSTLI